MKELVRSFGIFILRIAFALRLARCGGGGKAFLVLNLWPFWPREILFEKFLPFPANDSDILPIAENHILPGVFHREETTSFNLQFKLCPSENPFYIAHLSTHDAAFPNGFVKLQVKLPNFALTRL